MVTVRFEKSAFEAIKKHLFRRRTEQVVFLFLSQSGDGELPTFEVADYYLVAPEELVHESAFHAEVSEETQAKVIKMAWDKQLALSEIHSHSGASGGTTFSPSDFTGFNDFVPHVWWRLKGGPYIALVFDRTDFDGLAWLSNPRDAVAVDRLVVDSKEYTPTRIAFRKIQEQREREQIRYSRQAALFGEEGQRKIKDTRVAVVGLGGLGSHVVQQLAYLGVERYILIDPDKASRSNLNRLIGATESDIGQKKVDVLSRLIQSVQQSAEIECIGVSLLSRKAFGGVRRADVVFGCVDNDAVRLVLLELCCAYRKPYIDLASDVPDGSTFGGRVVFTGLGKGCLSCREEFDQEEIRRFFATPEQRQEDDRIYGIDRAVLAETGPSIVSLNGMIASTAVTEFMKFVTGIRPPFPHLVCRWEMGTVNRPPAPPDSQCYYCCGVWNGSERVDLEKYLSRAENQHSKVDHH